jgi:hypothetical protein
VGVEHLSGVAAGAVAAIREIVRGRFAQDDRAGRSKSRHLERVAPNGVRKKPCPFGAGAGGRQPRHVVDRLGKHRNTIERPAQPAGTGPRVGGPGVRGDGVGKRIDGAPCFPRRSAAIERASRDFGGGPVATPEPRLVIRGRAVERVAADGAEPLDWEGKRDECGELRKGFATAGRHQEERGEGWATGGETESFVDPTQ